MGVYDLQNVTIEAVGDPVVCYRIRANSGYYIHLPQHEENSFARIVVLRTDYDFSTVQIVAEADLPEGAEIHGDTEPGHEVM